MKTKNVVEELASDSGGIVCRLARGQMNHLCQAINKDSDGIMSARGPRELWNEIHGNAGPRIFGDLKGLKEAIRVNMAVLASLACIARLNILAYIL